MKTPENAGTKPEALASEDGYATFGDFLRDVEETSRMVQVFIDGRTAMWWSEWQDHIWSAFDSTLLTRAPRAESNARLKDALKLYNDEVVARMAAEAERDELQSLFDHQQSRMGRATEHWREMHYTDKTPDLGDLLEWLTARSRRLDVQERLAVKYYDKAEAAEAERDRLKAIAEGSDAGYRKLMEDACKLRQENEALRKALPELPRGNPQRLSARFIEGYNHARFLLLRTSAKGETK